MSGALDIHPDDALAIGYKVAEMADRVAAMDALVPRSQAHWGFTADDIRFKVVIARDRTTSATVGEPHPASDSAFGDDVCRCPACTSDMAGIVPCMRDVRS